MASRPPPRFVVRRHDEPSPRRHLWLGLAWLGSLLLVGLVVGIASRRSSPVAADHRQQRELQAQVADLQQQVANLQRAAQVNEVATRSLRGTLAQREEEVNGLRADLGFYSRLVGSDAQREGLKLQEVKFQPVTGTRGWNFTLSLTQNAKRGDETSGTVTVSVEGLRDNKVVSLAWPSLGDAAQKDGLPFRFMYFQQLHGTIVLPADFRPMRVHLLIQPASGESINRTVAWGAALSGNNTISEGDRDVQPQAK